MKRCSLALTLALLFLSGGAKADILLLRGGGRVEGVVKEEAKGLLVRSLHGSTLIPRSKVAARVRAPYITELYEKRKSRTDRKDPAARFRLALWCLANGLEKRARGHLREVIALDPDHARARARLGFVRCRGRWMTPDAVRVLRLAEAGLARVEGRWMTEEALRVYRAAKRRRADLLAVAREKRAAREAGEAKAEKERRAEKAAEEARARAEADRRERDRLIAERDALLDLLFRRRLYEESYYGGFYGYGTWSPLRVLPAAGRGVLLPGFGPRTLGARSLDFRGSRGGFGLRGRVR